MLCVDIKLGLDFNQLPLKLEKRSFHVLLINKTRLNSTRCLKSTKLPRDLPNDLRLRILEN